jgi:hypothetical protein
VCVEREMGVRDGDSRRKLGDGVNGEKKVRAFVWVHLDLGAWSISAIPCIVSLVQAKFHQPIIHQALTAASNSSLLLSLLGLAALSSSSAHGEHQRGHAAAAIRPTGH